MPNVVKIGQESVSVEPGAQASTDFTVRNASAVVATLRPTVLGDAGPWAQVVPPETNLYPDAEATFTVVFSPPRTSEVQAGAIPFGIMVRSLEDDTNVTVQEGTILLGAFNQLEVLLLPQTARSKRRTVFQTAVTNHGNEPVDVALQASGEDDALDISVLPARAMVGGGRHVVGQVTVTAHERHWQGQPEPHQIGVVATGANLEPVQASATWLQVPVLSKTVKRLGLALLALLALAAAVLAIPTKGGETETKRFAPATSLVAGGASTTTSAGGSGGSTTTGPGGGAAVTLDDHKSILKDTTDGSPAIVSFNNQVRMVWTKPDTHKLNVGQGIVTKDPKGKYMVNQDFDSRELDDGAMGPPVLAASGSQLVVAWAGMDKNLNVMPSDDGYHFDEQRKTTLKEQSPTKPALASLDNRLYLAWVDNGSHLNLMYSDDGGRSFNPNTKTTFQDQASMGPSLYATGDGGALVIAWVDKKTNDIMMGGWSSSGQITQTIDNKRAIGEKSSDNIRLSPSPAKDGVHVRISWVAADDTHDLVDEDAGTTGFGPMADKRTYTEAASAAMSSVLVDTKDPKAPALFVWPSTQGNAISLAGAAYMAGHRS